MKAVSRDIAGVALLALFLAAGPVSSQSPSPNTKAKELVKKMRQLKENKKQEREAAIQKLKAKLTPLMKYTIKELQLALTLKVSATYGDAKVIADDEDRTYLGKIADEFSSESIFNDYGRYGSEYSSTSIWNAYRRFGGEYSLVSPFNAYSVTPPLIVKRGRVIGRLTVNKHAAGAVDPNWLKSHFTY